METSLCPGCALRSADDRAEGQSNARFNASGACWQLFCELSAYTLTRGRERFIHQHAVDAYQLQHVIDRPSHIGTAFSAIGLYLAVEKGLSGRDAQRAHVRLARLRKQWPAFERPAGCAQTNIGDVMAAQPGNARDDAIMRWAAAVWAWYEPMHAWTRAVCQELLHITAPAFVPPSVGNQ